MTLSPEKQQLIQNAGLSAPYVEFDVDGYFFKPTSKELGLEALLRESWAYKEKVKAAEAEQDAHKQILLAAAKNDSELALAAANAAADALLKRVPHSYKDASFLSDIFPLIEDRKSVPLPEVKGLARLAAPFTKSASTPAQEFTPAQELMIRIGRCALLLDSSQSWAPHSAHDVLNTISSRSDFPAEQIMAAVVVATKAKRDSDYQQIMRVAKDMLVVLPRDSLQAEKLTQNIISHAFFEPADYKDYSSDFIDGEKHHMLWSRLILAECAKNNQVVLAQVVDKIKAATQPFKESHWVGRYIDSVEAAAIVLANLVDIDTDIDAQTRQDLTRRIAGVLTNKTTTKACFDAHGLSAVCTRINIGEQLYRLSKTDDVLRQALPWTGTINGPCLSQLEQFAENGYPTPVVAAENKHQLS